MTRSKLIRHTAFVLRCSGSATLSYLLADSVHLPHPVWASMSSLIVSQDSLSETSALISGRIAGTIIGVCVAAGVYTALADITGAAGQIAVAVAICALFARWRPAIRVCLWTAPIVLLTATPSDPIVMVAFYRASEVILGGLVGGVLQFAAEKIVAPLAADRGDPEAAPEEK